jgi:hypothetical protein
MPRPMIPAPMTAMVLTGAIDWAFSFKLFGLCFFQISDGCVHGCCSPAQSFGEALLLLGVHVWDVDANAA